MSSTVKILRDARALIEDPARWTTGRYARDQDDYAVPTDSSDACKFCAIGAISRVADLSPREAEDALEMVLRRQLAKDAWISQFNDANPHAEVLALFDRAIAAEEAALAGGQGEGR